MAEYYEVLFRHWGEQIRAMQAERQRKIAETVETKVAAVHEVLEIPDDDGDLIELEKRSLQQAQRGIVLEDMEVVFMGSSTTQSTHATNVVGNNAVKEEKTSLVAGSETKQTESYDQRIKAIQLLALIAITFFFCFC